MTLCDDQDFTTMKNTKLHEKVEDSFRSQENSCCLLYFKVMINRCFVIPCIY